MIENNKQLEVTEYWIELFKKAIENKETMKPFWSELMNPLIHQAELDGMRSKLKELEEGVVRYKSLVQLTEEGGST